MKKLAILILVILIIDIHPSYSEEMKTVTVTAVGDIMMGTDFPKRYEMLPPDDGKDLFVHVADILGQGDVVFGNLEQVLSDNGQCAKDISRPNMWAFRSPAMYANNLKKANFNVVSIANNHAWDFGKEGSADTMRALDAVGIRHSGPIGDIAELEISGFHIAVIAFSRNLNGYSFLDTQKSKAIIKTLSNQFDMVIVSFHGGAEGIKAQHTKDVDEYLGGESRGNVVKFARKAIDNGADLVIGHGPHVPRAIELYKNKLIAYSLGNFCTYGIISIKGVKGIAPILKIELAPNGDFVSGRIYSFKQTPPGYPVPDETGEAIGIMKRLSEIDFPNSGLLIDEDGSIRIKQM